MGTEAGSQQVSGWRSVLPAGVRPYTEAAPVVRGAAVTTLAGNVEALVAFALEGERSQYDVVADGSLVFSKQREGRFPEDDEVVALLG